MAQADVARSTQEYIQRYTRQFLQLLTNCDSEQIWAMPPGGGNSLGTLAHHLAGNYRQYFGAGILKNGYQRQRDREFSDRDIPKETLISNLEAATLVMSRALESIDETQVRAPHTTPDGRDFQQLSTFLVHLAAHCSYHVGQASYATPNNRRG